MNYPVHGVTAALDTAKYTESDQYGLEGIAVSLSSGSSYTYNPVIDLGNFDPTKPLVSLCITPKTISGSQGDAEAKAWGCDLTYDYVKINGDYRT